MAVTRSRSPRPAHHVNVVPDPTHIRASKGGVQFTELDVTVQAGLNITYAVVHADE